MQPLLQWKINKYYIFRECVYSLWYSACSTHAPYRHLWPASLYTIFSTLSQTRHNFRKEATERKMHILISSTTFVRNIFHSMKKLTRCDQKCVLVFRLSTHYSCPIFMKPHFSRQFFSKYTHISSS